MLHREEPVVGQVAPEAGVDVPALQRLDDVGRCARLDQLELVGAAELEVKTARDDRIENLGLRDLLLE
ncbi:MAG: hypothetical protein ACYTEG_00095 [Planctomycetota bacterium]|jgi:hypothetical protein